MRNRALGPEGLEPEITEDDVMTAFKSAYLAPPGEKRNELETRFHQLAAQARPELSSTEAYAAYWQESGLP